MTAAAQNYIIINITNRWLITTQRCTRGIIGKGNKGNNVPGNIYRNSVHDGRTIAEDLSTFPSIRSRTEVVESFTYLGCLIHCSGSSEPEIKRRANRVREAMFSIIYRPEYMAIHHHARNKAAPL